SWDYYRWKERRRIAAAYGRNGKDQKSHGHNDRSDDKRRLRSIAIGQPARPARQKKHQKDEWQHRCAGSRCGITLYLNQVQREEKQEAAQSAIEEQRQ